MSGKFKGQGLKVDLGGSNPKDPKGAAGEEDVQRLTEVISKVQMGKMTLNASEFEEICILGSGSGGVVKKARHKPTGTIMANKVITLSTTEQERKLIERELEILKDLNSPSIVHFHGAFLSTSEIHVCMEYMDVGSFDTIYPKVGTIPEDILGKVAASVLEGLVYLYKTYKIIHRDMKPSNILLNSKGEVKICDFGVSGVILNSVEGAHTFVGTSYYMSPNRIQGKAYSARSDSWSLGISLLEMAIGKFPIDLKKDPKSPKKVGVFDLLTAVVKEPSPKLPSEGFSPEFQDFIAKCLVKEDDDRPTPAELLNHPFIVKSKGQEVDFSSWVRKVQEKK